MDWLQIYATLVKGPEEDLRTATRLSDLSRRLSRRAPNDAKLCASAAWSLLQHLQRQLEGYDDDYFSGLLRAAGPELREFMITEVVPKRKPRA